MKTIEIESRTLIEAKYALKHEVARARALWSQAKHAGYLDKPTREHYAEIHRDVYCGAKRALAEISSFLA